MSIFLDGTQNLSAIVIPGVQFDIIPPKPNLIGSPTNKVGLVGVASWGKVGAQIPVSSPTDGAVKIGNPKVRPYDMASYIEFGNQIGPLAAYQCVRVTDGTDVAATASIQNGALSLTAACTGSLGNQIRVSLAQGTAVGSFLATIAFPGAPAEVFNNIGQGIGSITVTGGSNYAAVPSVIPTYTFAAANNPNNKAPIVRATLVATGAIPGSVTGTGWAVNDTITLTNGVVVKVATLTGGGIATVTVVNGGSLVAGAIPFNPVGMVSTSGAGVGNPVFTLNWSLGAPIIMDPGSGLGTVSLALSGGGGGTGGAYAAAMSPWLNLANAINNGNATRGPSAYVVASAGSSSVAPTLGTATSLTGGTDGAAGVTDQTLIGVDTFPRKGMYALRGSGIAALGLCDLSTAALWPTMDAFALSEATLNCVSTVSGDTIANASATRVSVGLDDMWTWICVGDWPTFNDEQNGVSRLISPVAAMVAFIGNSSPEQSPLNKQLRGISATQRTQTGQPYADADLQVLETSGIDAIVGPPTTPGGDFFSFATGLNASSNTSANGVNYTTLTNYLARTATSKAAGSIVGRLQSIRPDDKTRSDAKALFDGFSAQLANPNSGSNGNGIIDTWSTQCDLSINPPDMQARGFLVLIWTVRYLNTVRYFIVKLMGGGNVTVSSQSTPPTVQQLQ